MSKRMRASQEESFELCESEVRENVPDHIDRSVSCWLSCDFVCSRSHSHSYIVLKGGGMS